MSDWLAARTKYVLLWHAVTSFTVRLRFFSKAHQESKQMSTRKDASRPWTLITGKRLKMYLKRSEVTAFLRVTFNLKIPWGLAHVWPNPPAEEHGAAVPVWGLEAGMWLPEPLKHPTAGSSTPLWSPSLSRGFPLGFLQHASSQFALLEKTELLN